MTNVRTSCVHIREPNRESLFPSLEMTAINRSPRAAVATIDDSCEDLTMWIGAVCGVMDANMFPQGFDTRYSVCNEERKIISWDNARDVNSVSTSGDTVLFISIFPFQQRKITPHNSLSSNPNILLSRRYHSSTPSPHPYTNHSHSLHAPPLFSQSLPKLVQ